MNIAIGYRWFETALGYHLHRALIALNHTVTYVGLATPDRAGYGETTSIHEIIKSLDPAPDLFLWIDPAGRYFPRDIEQLPIPTACYLVDVHLGHWRKQAAKFFDVVFVAQKNVVQSFKASLGHDQVYWLPLAAASDVHYDHHIERIYDVGFVGNMLREHVRSGRARRLKLIQTHFKTNDFYRSYTPAEVGQVYSQSKIVFNTSIAGDITMRLFEGAACGAMMLTDETDNGLTDLFKTEQEIVTFKDDDDLLIKLNNALTHANQREQIANAGQIRVMAQHTYHQRATILLAHIAQAKPIALMRSASPNARLATRKAVFTHLHMLDALFDDAKQTGYNLPQKLWQIMPCLARRILR